MDMAEVVQAVEDWDASVVAASDAEDWWEVAGRERRSTVLHDPADPAAVDALEARIGRRLPPSYRWFLERSDGADSAFTVVGLGREGFFPAAQVDWLVRTEPLLPHLGVEQPPEGWSDPENDPRQGELAWLAACFLGGQSHGRTLHGHLGSCLAISGLEDKSAVLLDPLVRDADGEWQCWDFFTHDTPRGYQSVVEYLIEQGRRALEIVERQEHEEGGGPEAADDATIALALRRHAVAPPWLGRLLDAPDPPSHLLGALHRMVDVGLVSEAARHVARVRGAGALDIAGRTWAAARPSSPLTDDDVLVLQSLSGSEDQAVRDWLVGVLQELLAQDPGLPPRLVTLHGLILGRLWHRTRSDAVLDQLLQFHHLSRVEEKEEILEVLLERLGDPHWRQGHVDLLASAITAVATESDRALPVLRRLKGQPGVPPRELARALLRLGDRDTAFAAEHLSLYEVSWLVEVPDEVRAEHRRVRVARASTQELLADLPASADPEATDQLLGLRGRVSDAALARALERQRSPGASDALVDLAADEPQAWRALARLGDGRSEPGLVALLDHAEPAARLFAGRGVRELGDPRGAVALVAAAMARPGEDELALVAAHAAVAAGVPAGTLLARLEATGPVHARLVAHWRG
jgi:hypothetical protein